MEENKPSTELELRQRVSKLENSCKSMRTTICLVSINHILVAIRFYQLRSSVSLIAERTNLLAERIGLSSEIIGRLTEDIRLLAEAISRIID